MKDSLFEKYIANKKQNQILDINVVKNIFKSMNSMMNDIYRNAWSNRNSSIDTQRIWIVTLCQLTEEQILSGLDKLEEKFTQYPPNPLQFKALCLFQKNNTEEQFYEKFSEMTDRFKPFKF
jgi:hypothetical protein